MLVTSNRSVVEWGTVFGDPVVATATLDRLLHDCSVITIRGDSYRLRKSVVPAFCRRPARRTNSKLKTSTKEGGSSSCCQGEQFPESLDTAGDGHRKRPLSSRRT